MAYLPIREVYPSDAHTQARFAFPNFVRPAALVGIHRDGMASQQADAPVPVDDSSRPGMPSHLEAPEASTAPQKQVLSAPQQLSPKQQPGLYHQFPAVWPQPPPSSYADGFAAPGSMVAGFPGPSLQFPMYPVDRFYDPNYLRHQQFLQYQEHARCMALAQQMQQNGFTPTPSPTVQRISSNPMTDGHAFFDHSNIAMRYAYPNPFAPPAPLLASSPTGHNLSARSTLSATSSTSDGHTTMFDSFTAASDVAAVALMVLKQGSPTLTPPPHFRPRSSTPQQSPGEGPECETPPSTPLRQYSQVRTSTPQSATFSPSQHFARLEIESPRHFAKPRGSIETRQKSTTDLRPGSYNERLEAGRRSSLRNNPSPAAHMTERGFLPPSPKVIGFPGLESRSTSRYDQTSTGASHDSAMEQLSECSLKIIQEPCHVQLRSKPDKSYMVRPPVRVRVDGDVDLSRDYLHATLVHFPHLVENPIKNDQVLDGNHVALSEGTFSQTGVVIFNEMRIMVTPTSLPNNGRLRLKFQLKSLATGKPRSGPIYSDVNITVYSNYSQMNTEDRAAYMAANLKRKHAAVPKDAAKEDFDSKRLRSASAPPSVNPIEDDEEANEVAAVFEPIRRLEAEAAQSQSHARDTEVAAEEAAAVKSGGDDQSDKNDAQSL